MAYLCDGYPAISHSFILSEVLGLRRLGAEIATISLRRGQPEHLLTSTDRREFETTQSILPTRPWTLAAAHLSALAARPLPYLATLVYALSIGAGTARGRLWQLFCFAEAALVWRHCKRLGIRHIHAQFASPAADVGLLAARLGDGRGRWRFSFAAHGTDISVSDQRLLAEKARVADFVICVSDFGRSQILSVLDEEHWDKVRVVRCGVDVRRFETARAPRPAGAPLRLLAVGRLHPVKGQAILLAALRLLLDQGLDVELTIVGDGPRRAALERRARDLGVHDKVDFAGYVGQDRIRDYYETADVFCLPSFGEGVPVVLMEAMAMGLPVVASAVMGIPELVEDGLSGLLVTPGRADLLAAAIGRLVEDPDLRDGLGRGGRTTVEARHERTRTVEQLRDVMLDALGS